MLHKIGVFNAPLVLKFLNISSQAVGVIRAPLVLQMQSVKEG